MGLYYPSWILDPRAYRGRRHAASQGLIYNYTSIVYAYRYAVRGIIRYTGYLPRISTIHAAARPGGLAK